MPNRLEKKKQIKNFLKMAIIYYFQRILKVSNNNQSNYKYSIN